MIAIALSQLPVHLRARSREMWDRLSDNLSDRSRKLVGFLDARMGRLIVGWAILLSLISSAKIATALARPEGLAGVLALVVPYALIVISPIAGYQIARSAFPRGRFGGQPSVRLAQVGSWQKLDPIEARSNPNFGPTGLLASLLLGLLLDVPMRTLEYMASVPAVGSAAPLWAQVYFNAMTLQLILLNFFGMVALVMALRNVSLFPRMLLFVWLFDLVLQLGVAGRLAATPGLPHLVVDPLVTLLQNNIRKVMISMLIWLPYLLLSERVNVTYRQRCSRV